MEQELEDLQIDDETEEDEVLVEYDIATYPSDFTLSIIHKMWHDGDIEIPKFQREFVWKIEQSSLLIESFLVGLPVPPVFFYIDEENKNLVIDGQQRILSAVYFFDGYFGEESGRGKRQVFRLAGLDERSPYHIFERLNTGGTTLKPHEIRNCVFRGEFAARLRELNENVDWRKLVGKVEHDKRQRDVELILRVFALSRRWQSYEKPMKEYLNVVMKRNRKGTSQAVARFGDLFSKTSELLVEELGERQFHIRGPLNASVLDSVFGTLMDNLGRVPHDLSNRYRQLLQDQAFLNGTHTSTTDTQVLRSRFKIAKQHLID